MKPLRSLLLLALGLCGLGLCGLGPLAQPAHAQTLPLSPAAEDTLAAGTIPLESAPDDAIARRLQGLLAQIDEFENVQVRVSDGVVQLTGTVLRPETVNRVEQLAARVEGVLYVDNDVEAETDVETRITPAIERAQSFLRRGVAFLPILAIALLVVALFGLLSYLIGRWRTPRRLDVNPLVWNLIRRLARAFIFLVGLLLAFDLLGITTMIGALLGAAGVLGIAIGFAFQDIVENYLAGLLLSIRRPFSINDLVRIDEHEGRIVRLTSRELLMLSLEGNHIRLPNATVFKSTLINYTLNQRRLFHFDVGIGLDEDITRAMAVGASTLGEMNGVMTDPAPFARMREIAASNVVIRFHGWVDQQNADYFKVMSEGMRLVKAALDEAGVELPEPIYRVLLHDAADLPPRKSPSSAVPAGRQAKEVDVTPSRELDEQVDDDLARPGQENLLLDRGDARSRR